MDETTSAPTGRHWTDRTTLTVTEAGDILGLSRSAAYEAIRRDEIPSFRVGGRILVPVPRLARMLGYALGTETAA